MIKGYHNVSTSHCQFLQHNSTGKCRDVISCTEQSVFLTKIHKNFAFGKYTETRYNIIKGANP